MGWYFDYLKSISKNRDEVINSSCPKGGTHEEEFWFGEFDCKKCGIKLHVDMDDIKNLERDKNETD